ncbi:MAG: STAS/SEC14 domain-containing protein [Desulfobacteraceae bacterium]
MSWHINYNEESRIIEITYSGNVTGQDIREATVRRISLQTETGATLILADASQSQEGPPLINVYDLPDRIYPEHDARRDTRIAFILPTHSKAKELAHFFQTAAKNRGWTIELFEERKDAFSWLTSEKNIGSNPG